MSVKVSPQENELVYWLVISQLPGMGPKHFAALLAIENRLSVFFNDHQPTKDFWQACELIGLRLKPCEDLLNWKQADKALLWQEGKKRHILTWNSELYPSRLKEIAADPPILFVEGEIEVLATQQLAIVGSRHPTVEGRSNAYHFAYELARRGFTITSGLALGIDGASHEGTLQAKGKTIAVLGQGINHIYPAQHQHLAEQIQENGALVSEFPLDTRPFPSHFPRRNRIISGLSQGVLVVESSEKSGSLITAKYAIEQNRELFAIPGSLHNPLAKGCHYLIRQGAKCVDNIQHILEEFPNNELLPSLSSFQQIKSDDPLLSFLSTKTVPIDALIQASGLTAERVSSMLIELELQGKVACVPGGYVRTAIGSMP